MLEELEALRRGDFSDKELARSREQLKGNFILGLDSPGSRMMSMGKSMLLYSQVRTETEILADIDRVTRETVQEAACRLLRPEEMAVAIVGPEDVEYEKILKSVGIG